MCVLELSSMPVKTTACFDAMQKYIIKALMFKKKKRKEKVILFSVGL